jgi:RNA polymerase sigma factor (sigma-70 family)
MAFTASRIAQCVSASGWSSDEEVTTDARSLFDAHAHSLYRYLVRLTGDPDLAADGVQNTFLRVVEGRARRKIERAWLFTVATNVVLQELRGNRRHARLLEGNAQRIPTADPAPDPYEQMESRERHDRALRALSVLSDKERSAVLMREEGFSHKEIADAVGTTTASVGTLIARALLKFADAVGNEA